MALSTLRHVYPSDTISGGSVYIYPIFNTSRNDVPLCAVTGIYEADHIREILIDYGTKHNNHLSPYNATHPDVLERRMHRSPDVESYPRSDRTLRWYVGAQTCHALNGAYFHSLQAYGDALQPFNWNRDLPFLPYDFDTPLAHLGMGPLPRPATFHEHLYHVPFESLGELQDTVHQNSFYAMCLYATSLVVNAVKMNNCHNLAFASYMRGSPGLVSAHRYWCRLRGFPVLDRSEDDESAADFDEFIQEPEGADNLAADASPARDSPMEEDEPEESPDYPSFSFEEWRAGALHGGIGPFGRDPFAFTILNSVRRIPGRSDDLLPITTNAAAGPSNTASIDPPHNLDRVISRLEALAISLVHGEPAGRYGTPIPGWDWPTEPAPPEAPAMGPPEWDLPPRIASPPLTWEEYWSSMKKEGTDLEEGKKEDE
ncbi:hypothetical protein V565_187450 [Rhizoctonia solani 123E]|uniref:Uncharacterized protein n=1 Tax=Rhizoctonia solani 123E TaxID=1423351 RepID=A0A074RPQ3_9AGAM|nr:hypothetical protein V565_187450 [Rhizoctonia solani 123E]